MKKTLFFLIAFGVILCSKAQEIKWLTLNEALTLQKKDPKPIFMDVYTPWCGPCKMLDNQTFKNKAFEEFIAKNYYTVKFNAEGNPKITYNAKQYSNPEYKEGQKGRNGTHQFADFLNLEGYPTMIIFDRKGAIAKSIVGFRTAEQLLSEIKL